MGDGTDEQGGGSQQPDDEPGGTRSRKRKGKQRPFWKELPLLIVIALVLAVLIKTFLLQAFSIPSDSMQNTLQPGDRVLVDKLTPWFGSQPERGEVVVFRDPSNWLQGEPTPAPNAVQNVLGTIGLMPAAGEKDLIKRVIAVGGDTVECRKDGPVIVNGKALNEPYIFPGDTPCNDKPFGPLRVPEGTIWVMGDHRQDSADSRWHMNDPKTHGFVPVKDVVGRAVVVGWPVTRWATLPIPETFSQPGLGAPIDVGITSDARPGSAP
ncbi:signal peptidase I [Streptomyces sp. NPDC056519]|uniref:signal peptidase I n=1 Tax=Streptomyces sp. NPDC056519 TaxID=3345849 RepID=UPI0036A21C1D